MSKRFLKIFTSKAARDAAIQANELDINSVSIWGPSVTEDSDGKIEFGVGNGAHQINLGINDVSNTFDDDSNNE